MLCIYIYNYIILCIILYIHIRSYQYLDYPTCHNCPHLRTSETLWIQFPGLGPKVWVRLVTPGKRCVTMSQNAGCVSDIAMENGPLIIIYQ
jgi:hypothetical protein